MSRGVWREATRIRKWFERIVKMPSGCWERQGSRTRTAGHAIASINGVSTTAHRVAWMMFRGPIPKGMYVLHRCDNPPCVNPDHLWLGTQAENLRDMTNKGRRNAARGERHLSAKLTAEQVRAIREDRRRKVDIAADYGVRPCTISNIQANRKWRHLCR